MWNVFFPLLLRSNEKKRLFNIIILVTCTISLVLNAKDLGIMSMSVGSLRQKRAERWVSIRVLQRKEPIMCVCVYIYLHIYICICIRFIFRNWLIYFWVYKSSCCSLEAEVFSGKLVFALRSSTDWIRPTNVIKDTLLYWESTGWK